MNTPKGALSKMSARKTLFTLNVGYPKAITDQTYPFLHRYAQKIGANFHVISERKFPNNDLEYEKLQICELGKDNDWNLYVDSDALIHPDLFDITTYLDKDTVLHHGIDSADLRWTFDPYFLRDGRRISSCNWFTVASNWCLDLWRPPEDLTEAEIVKRICPTNYERAHGVEAKHLVSDYILSRNIARYGLKVQTLMALLKRLGRENDAYCFHQYTISQQEKISQLAEVIAKWQLNVAPGGWVDPKIEIKQT